MLESNYKKIKWRNDSMTDADKLFMYMLTTKDCINMPAIFSDETPNFVSEDSIKIRAAKDNIETVFIVANGERKLMSKTSFDFIFDYFKTPLPFQNESFRYHFEIHFQNEIYFYNKKGLYDVLDSTYDFQFIHGFKTPDWAKGAVMYQIFVDRFYNADKTNDVVNNEYLYLGRAAKHVDWNKPVEQNDMCMFYGGDLDGVIQKLDYLKDLGIDAIYFNPLFVSPSSHKYDIQDYDHIDPHFGKIVVDEGEPLYFENFNNKSASKYVSRVANEQNLTASDELFIKLVERAHALDIKIILDGVFNHCGAFNKWLDRENFYGRNGHTPGAYAAKDSVYHDYFRWYDDNWPNNDCYDSWWGFDNHPKLNFEQSPALCDYIMQLAKKWMSPPFNADGWRLDVAADVGYSPEFNHKFWQMFREAVKSANPNAIILAEHYGNPRDWLMGNEWDSVMNYDAFMEPITWFLTGMEKHSEEFRPEKLCNAMEFENSMRFYMSQFNFQSLYVAMNELSNHDHSRFLTRTNQVAGRLIDKGSKAAELNIDKNVMMEAVVFQMTWPGCPTIYYGDEVGLCGWSDPDNRRPFPWDNQDINMLNFHKEIIKLHKRYECIKLGSVEFLRLDFGVLSYARWLGDEKIIVVINNNSVKKQLTIPVWKANCKNNDTLIQILSTADNSFDTTQKAFKVMNGIISIELSAKASVILSSN